MLVPNLSAVNRQIKRVKRGSGFLNTLINKLPIELHIPGYNFCGPGTKLEKSLLGVILALILWITHASLTTYHTVTALI
jgi:hypothetical protein